MPARWCVCVLTFVVACGDNLVVRDAPDASVAPAFRDPVALPDEALAGQALALLGGCSACHGLTADRLRYWRGLGDTALATCLTDLAVTTPASARAMIACMRALPEPGADFETTRLGVFATAARLPWFQYLFDQAYGDTAPAELATFIAQAGMPRGDAPPLTQADFDIIAEWFVRGLPALDQVLVGQSPPTACQAAIAPDVAAHVTAMATQGWGALDAQAGLAMQGCGSATDPHQCLQSYPRATSWEVAGQLRVLHDASYETLYWTRSSPDGRFVAHGVANIPGSYILDLQRALDVPVAAEEDPAFFPDNSAFVFQGGTKNTCPIRVLTSDPASVSMTEPGCEPLSQLGLYEQLASTLGGGDEFALAGPFVSDDGGKPVTLADPPAAFVATSSADFTPLIFDGSGLLPRATVSVATPFEGDAVLSPSAGVMMSRLAGPGDRQLGYVLRKVDATFTGSTYAISAPVIATYCMTGGKPAFSYDERYVVFHHYVDASDAVDLGFTGPADPAFAPYLSLGAANLYLMELATGTARRITNMQPGQYALYPHFRADGWIYAQVRDHTTGHELTIASDAALQ